MAVRKLPFIQRLLNVSLQVKILGLVVSLIVLIIVSLTSVFFYMESREDTEQAEELALQTSKTLSYMPGIQEAFLSPAPNNINPLVEQIRDQVDASFIRIVHKDGTIYANPGDMELQDELDDLYRSRVFGSYYVTHSEEEEPNILKGISPIIIDYGAYKRVVGTVEVAFNVETIQHKRLFQIFRR
ncbi:hypothetical protein [Radiobacillus deserti]|uniref:hypothetical protein n=1 Tax=Radiobacillus deserti TaxID=2594883 RepID=UPI001E62EB3C|nr:hypothetical protein [Radiobacillus deserti]